MWTRGDSNSRPPACKAGALPTKLRAQVEYIIRKENKKARLSV